MVRCSPKSLTVVMSITISVNLLSTVGMSPTVQDLAIMN